LEKLNFYDINIEYIKYLQKFDSKIPNIEYSETNKFVCGIVLNINSFNYYAPISSFRTKQKTNILIYDKDKIISSVRFSFMFPAPKSVLKVKNIKADQHKILLDKELRYCNSIREEIFQTAKRVYKYGTNPKRFYFKNCCNFKILELKSKLYE
jgi:protein AbiQ